MSSVNLNFTISFGNNTNKIDATKIYEPVKKHWFYMKKDGSKTIWLPFTKFDSNSLEERFLSTENFENDTIVQTDDGRFDVDVIARTRTPAYWSGKPEIIQRCSWFYKTIDSGYIPYEESIADLLEEEYKICIETGVWQRKITLPDDETIAFHSSTVMVHFFNSQDYSIWKNTSVASRRPRVLRRGIEEFEIDAGETSPVDHLLFLVHGIGGVCDLKMRSVEQVVDDFRVIANQLIQSHYKTSYSSGRIGRIEVLPISWHYELHSEDSGIDDKLKEITLGSISRLRTYTNETILDVLFYTSPVFCQTIINTVGDSLNRLYTLFRKRNPEYSGAVSLGGHSLGSLILFDLLCHQNEHSEHSRPGGTPEYDRPSKTHIGAGQPSVKYPQLLFKPLSFYALGSPIGMFVTIRGIDELGVDFALPTCESFYNIFHPYDPVAYRIEPLVNSELTLVPPVLIPHHKGRKRIHLELKETLLQVRGNIKQKFTTTFRDTIDTIQQLMFPRAYVPRLTDATIPELEHIESANTESASESSSSSTEDFPMHINVGLLNKKQRIDYVLQEAPLEYFNEYLFALTSHVGYWESEDTILFIVKDIYTAHGVAQDTGLKQHTLNIDRDILTKSDYDPRNSNAVS